ncbi:MAG: hypothetical protein HN367_07425 [Candidatus Marinimicrobia bacterium]|nr:hypothetical protein [Candidatus Neomarinimicrobiota bacterium]
MSIHLILGTILLSGLPTPLKGVDCNQCHVKSPNRITYKSSGFSEKAVGVMDKGQLQNNTSNFGDLSNYHAWFTNAGHWPRTGNDDRQYVYGLGLVVAVNKHNVIETVSQAMSKVTDWLPTDNASGREYSGDIRAESDDTPFQASSDFRETWPLGYYDESGNWVNTDERTWPGIFRVDVGNISDDSLALHLDSRFLPYRENEFTSDRDIFCTYNDDNNVNGSVGIKVEQSSYSYGRPYAEDFIFWDLKISNTSDIDLDSIYIGFYTKFRPDYDNHDYINFIDSDGDGKKDFVYVYDLNNERNKTWAHTEDPLGIPGLRIFDTPSNMGVTDFHHFARGVSPTTDEQLWALMTSDKDTSVLDSISWYFHGDDQRIDHTGIDSLSSFYPSWYDEESNVELEGDGINFIISSGPYSLKADSTTTISLGMIMGHSGDTPNAPDTTDLMNNLRMANNMYRLYFQGSGPPDPPNVTGVAGNNSASLFWSSEPSESTIDVLSNEKDFEGYKIFRSTDAGKTWGSPVTDAYGIQVGWVPIATFDYSLSEDLDLFGEDISGLDPAYPQLLGTNTGLVHTYIDSNLINGLEYWYCVTSYDKGVQNSDIPEQSYLYPLGSSIYEPHTVSVIPGPAPINISDAIVPSGHLTAKGGLCDAVVKVEIANPENITGHGYKIIFSDSVLFVEDGDTSYNFGFTLIDTTDIDTLFYQEAFSDETEDNLPVVDGFRIMVQNSASGIKELGWTKVLGDTSTFDWRFKSKYPDLIAGNQAFGEKMDTYDDFRITVDTSTDGGIDAKWFDLFAGDWAQNLVDGNGVQFDSIQNLPLKIEIVSDPDNPIDVSDYLVQCDFRIEANWNNYRHWYYSPLGWDLIPGGKGFSAGSTNNGWWYELHVDILILSGSPDTWDNYLYLLTNNTPDTYINSDGETINQTAIAPSHGDQFTIKTFKPIREEIYYTFGTIAQSEKTISGNSLSDIRVVPDPYIVTNIWEKNEFGKKLQFNHLPSQCTIKIYTLVGDQVSTINHDSNTGYEFWNMRTKNDQFIAPGVYLYHVTTPNGDENMGRFLVIK